MRAGTAAEIRKIILDLVLALEINQWHKFSVLLPVLLATSLLHERERSVRSSAVPPYT